MYYAGLRGDIDRILRGFDSDGDVCGKKNPRLVNITQSGKDLTLKP